MAQQNNASLPAQNSYPGVFPSLPKGSGPVYTILNPGDEGYDDIADEDPDYFPEEEEDEGEEANTLIPTDTEVLDPRLSGDVNNAGPAAADFSSASSSSSDEDSRSRTSRLSRSSIDNVSSNAPVQEERHFRGIENPHHKASKLDYWRSVWGGGEPEILSMVALRDLWTGLKDFTLPRKESIREWERARDCGKFGVGTDFGVKKEDVQVEKREGWDWYYGPEGREVRERQLGVRLEKIEARRYFADVEGKQHTVFMGLRGSQRGYEMKVGESMDLASVWPANEGAASPIREAWLMFLGDKIRSLGWAPNCPGPTQYLAVALEAADVEGVNHSSAENTSKLFSPEGPNPATIQIWSFESAVDERGEGLTRRLDMTKPPRLRKVICMDWGRVKQFTWNRVGRELRSEDQVGGRVNLGLIGGVWGDGYARVLDVWIDETAASVEYERITSPMFEARAPDAISTCMAFLSPSEIIIGNARGYISIYNIVNQSHLPPRDSGEASQRCDFRPIIHSRVCPTFILSLDVAYPSAPTFVTINAMDGHIRLINLKSYPVQTMQASTITTVRNRLAQTPLIFSPFLNAFVTPDENAYVRALPLRRFFGSVTIFQHSSGISSLSTGHRVHPCLLVGGWNGDVKVSVPVRKILYYKQKTYTQTWFRHDWVRNPQHPLIQPYKAGSQDFELPNILPLEAGTTQIHEGFETELAFLPHTTNSGEASFGTDANIASPVKPKQKQSQAKKKKGPKSKKTKALPISNLRSLDAQSNPNSDSEYDSDTQFMAMPPSRAFNVQNIETNYEERSAITALDWNPNPNCGTLAAAGTGTGLLRVEDLGVVFGGLEGAIGRGAFGDFVVDSEEEDGGYSRYMAMRGINVRVNVSGDEGSAGDDDEPVEFEEMDLDEDDSE